MKIFYSDTFVLPLPPDHRFPMRKYSLLRQRLVTDPNFQRCNFLVPKPASDRALKRVHSEDYIRQLNIGQLPRAIERRIGFPWSPQMIERSRRSVGATMSAAYAALHEGVAVNLAGGTHHAFRDTGGGYCVLNDTVVAARWVLDQGWAKRILVVDLDVHQGDGTAALCAEDERIFTLSIHGDKNYPARKQCSDMDIALADGTDDQAYLNTLQTALPQAMTHSQATLAFFLAGADPYVDDRLGRLSLSKAGLKARDEYVFRQLAEAGISVAVAMAGGYAERLEDIVDIHATTVALALQSHQRWAEKRFKARTNEPA